MRKWYDADRKLFGGLNGYEGRYFFVYVAAKSREARSRRRRNGWIAVERVAEENEKGIKTFLVLVKP
jgi:hypothetical protein